MKKIAIFIVCIFLLSACTKINDTNYNDIISNVVNSRYDVSNQYKTGYKYYAPRGLSPIVSNDYNEVLSSSKYRYYLYVDVVSYYNRVIKDYKVDNNAYFSSIINFEDKYGYLEINKQDNKKYLVEIMYNYAKIEVMVEECDLAASVTNSIIILSSIEYNNDILSSIIGDNALEFNEETFNIFETKKKESNYLDVYTNDENDDENSNADDPDLIK